MFISPDLRIIISQSLLASVYYGLRCLPGSLLKHFQNDNGVMINPIDDPPSSFLVVDP